MSKNNLVEIADVWKDVCLIWMVCRRFQWSYMSDNISASLLICVLA